MRRFSKVDRIALLVIAGVVVLTGVAVWSFQDTYGGTEYGDRVILADGTVRIFETRDSEESPKVVAFEGTAQQADEFLAETTGGFDVYWFPGLIIGVGGLLVVWALVAPARPKKQEP